MKRHRVLVLVHDGLVPREGIPSAEVDPAWRMEWDVVTTLRERGHELKVISTYNDLTPIRSSIEEFKPDIVFNLLEAFDGICVFDQNVVSYLELLKIPYTGCNPRGLMLARDKALAKQVMSYHRIPYPEFMVVPLHRMVRRPKYLPFPLIVKSISEEASLGISQASIVDDDEKLRERVAFIHDNVGTGALIERYIEGRELYVGVMGNAHLQVFPVWELVMDKMPDEARRIATERVKWSRKYQDKYGICSCEARNLPDGVVDHIQHLAKRVYRALGLSGYARIDMRMDKDGNVYVLEANPNPQIATGEDFADSAEKADLAYKDLLQELLHVGLRWRPAQAA